jgi:hypothetical protein
VFCDQRERSVAPTSAIERGRSMAVRSRRFASNDGSSLHSVIASRQSRRSNLVVLCAHNLTEVASSLRFSQ